MIYVPDTQLIQACFKTHNAAGLRRGEERRRSNGREENKEDAGLRERTKVGPDLKYTVRPLHHSKTQKI